MKTPRRRLLRARFSREAQPPRRPPGRGGFSIIEITVVIGILTVMMTMMIVTISTLVQAERRDAVFQQRLTNQAAISDQFRSDVGLALSAPPHWLQFQAGPHCLILQHDNDTHIIYQWDKNQLMRLHIQAGITIRRLMPGSDRAKFSIGPKQCRLRLGAEDGPDEDFPSDITAALGGERR